MFNLAAQNLSKVNVLRPFLASILCVVITRIILRVRLSIRLLLIWTLSTVWSRLSIVHKRRLLGPILLIGLIPIRILSIGVSLILWESLLKLLVLVIELSYFCF